MGALEEGGVACCQAVSCHLTTLALVGHPNTNIIIYAPSLFP